MSANTGEAENLVGEVRVQIHTPDLHGLGEFYSSRLGLETVATFPNDEGMLLRLVGDVLIELLPGGGEQPGLHLSVEVRSIGSAHHRWKSIAEGAPATQPWGHLSFDVADPQGNRITFFEVIS